MSRDIGRDWDLIVVGGGAGGLSAARAGAAAGRSVLLIQDGPLGGDCTFTGCVPSKTLIAAAAAGLDAAAAWSRIRAVVARIAGAEDDEALRREGVTVHHGRARLAAGPGVDIDGRVLRATRIIVATGSAPVLPVIPGLGDVTPLTTDDLWSLAMPPRDLAILGGGAIGCELAQALARLGATVRLLEAEPRLLGREEPDAAGIVAGALAADGVDVRVGARVRRVGRDADGVVLELADGPPVRAGRLLVATGRAARTEGLAPERAGVALGDRGEIVVDDRLMTSAAGVLAVGDVTGSAQLTHLADEMGRLAVGNAFARRGRRLSVDAVPWVTFTDPEVARVGITEAEAGRRARVAELPMDRVDRAIAEDRTEGFVRLVATPRPLIGRFGGGRLVGATIVAPRAGEMIHEAVLAVRSGMFAGRIAQAVHAYPTWSTAMRQAAAQLVPAGGGPRARPPRR